MELAAKLEEQNPQAIVIFISNHEEAVFEAIHYKPFRFIRKAYLQAELSEALQSLKKQKEKRARFITLDVKEQQIVLPVKEIVYIESQAHYLLFHVMNSEREEQVVRSRGKISDYAEKMLIFHFLRPGKSYLVNSMWIQNFNLKEITVKTGQHIPVSRDKKEEVKKQYFGYMRSRIYEMD